MSRLSSDSERVESEPRDANEEKSDSKRRSLLHGGGDGGGEGRADEEGFFSFPPCEKVKARAERTAKTRRDTPCRLRAGARSNLVSIPSKENENTKGYEGIRDYSP
uniref:Uncharacterized protein n=1 Tax=Vespula pensylvanica TaxID=30213 RepID=A0A834NLY2_VESPE|nr:hypothetical protein H0235_012999 [Vespula pensylvanica]